MPYYEASRLSESGIVNTYNPTALGIIYDSGESGFVADDVTITGTGMSIVGGDLRFANGNTNFNHYLELTPTGFAHEDSNFESWSQWVKFNIEGRSSVSFGIGIGVKGQSIGTNFEFSNIAQFGMGTDANQDKALFYYKDFFGNNDPFTTWQITDVVSAFSANTDYWLKIERNGDELSMSLYEDDRTTLLGKQSRVPNSGDAEPPTGDIGYDWENWHYAKAGKWALWNFGAGFATNVKRWIIEVEGRLNTWKDVDWLFLGDSNTIGEKNPRSDNYMNHIINTQGINANRITNYSGGSNTLNEVEACIDSIVAMNPTNILVNLGSNDVALVSTATAEARLESLLDALRTQTSARIAVCTPIARNGVDFTSFNVKLNSEASEHGYDVVDLYDDSQDSGNLKAAYDSGDGIHLSGAGHDGIGNRILADLPNDFK